MVGISNHGLVQNPNTAVFGFWMFLEFGCLDFGPALYSALEHSADRLLGKVMALSIQQCHTKADDACVAKNTI